MADIDITDIIKRHKGAIVSYEPSERHHYPALGDMPAITFQSQASINIKLLCPTQPDGNANGTTLLRAVVDKFMAVPGASLVNSDELEKMTSRRTLTPPGDSRPFAVIELNGKRYHISQTTSARDWSSLTNEIKILELYTGQSERTGTPQELAEGNRELQVLARRLGLDPDLKPSETLPDGTVKYPGKVIAPDSDKDLGCPAASIGHITPTRVAQSGRGDEQAQASRTT